MALRPRPRPPSEGSFSSAFRAWEDLEGQSWLLISAQPRGPRGPHVPGDRPPSHGDLRDPVVRKTETTQRIPESSRALDGPWAPSAPSPRGRAAGRAWLQPFLSWEGELCQLRAQSRRRHGGVPGGGRATSVLRGSRTRGSVGPPGVDQLAAQTRLWVSAGTTVGLHFPLHKMGESGAGTQGSEGWGRGGVPGA